MRRLRLVLRMLLVPAVGFSGACVGWAAEASGPATTLLLFEPALWVAGAWLAYAAWLRGDQGLGVGVLCAGLAAAIGVRIPLAPAETPGLDPAPFLEQTRTCARNLALPAERVRLVQWTVARDMPGIALVITDEQADVVVVRGPLSVETIEAVRAGVGGEAMEMAGANGPIHVFTRGAFSLCGDSDRWVDLPAPGSDVGLVFVAIAEGTAFPLLLAGLPAAGSVPAWSSAQRAARDGLHTAVDGLESSLLVVALDAPLPLAGPRLTRTLRDVDLSVVARPLNWPARSPLPLHAFDQVWAAEGWLGAPAVLLRAAGTERHGVRVDLVPRWPVVLPAAGDDKSVR